MDRRLNYHAHNWIELPRTERYGLRNVSTHGVYLDDDPVMVFDYDLDPTEQSVHTGHSCEQSRQSRKSLTITST